MEKWRNVVSTCLGDDLFDLLVAEARRRNLPLSGMIRWIIMQFFKVNKG